MSLACCSTDPAPEPTQAISFFLLDVVPAPTSILTSVFVSVLLGAATAPLVLVVKNGRTNELKNGRTDERKNGRAEERTSGRVEELTNRRTEEQVNEQTEERKNKQMEEQTNLKTDKAIQETGL